MRGIRFVVGHGVLTAEKSVFEADFFLYIGNAPALIGRGKGLVSPHHARDARVRKRKANRVFSIGTY